MAVRVHPFPSRTRQLSSLALTILGWKRPGKISRCRPIYSSLAQSVEHAAVNRRVVGSSPTGGAIKKPANTMFAGFFMYKKRLAGRVVRKKANADDIEIKTPFAKIRVDKVE